MEPYFAHLHTANLKIDYCDAYLHQASFKQLKKPISFSPVSYTSRLGLMKALQQEKGHL